MIAYGAPAIRALLPAALILLAVAGTVTAADDTARRLLAQASAPVGKGTRSEIQNVQRLLKLLSSRYPEKYASADPKRVDGVFGDDTAIAIKNFQKTSGVSTPPRNNEALVSEILAALARMSSLKPKQPQVATPKAQQPAKPKAAAAPAVPKVTAPPVPKVVAPPVPRPETRTTPPIATKPAEGPVPKVVAKPVTQPPAKPPVPKAAPPTSTSKPVTSPPKPVVAQKAKPKKPTAAPNKAARAKPANDRLLYFVQVASLRDSQAAKREWRRIRDSNRAALGAENVYYEKANIKGRGVFYRILVGPVRDRETAAVLCSLLKRNGQTCVTTQRNLSAIKDPNAVIPSDPNKPDQQSRLADDKELAEGAGVSRPKKSKPSDSASSKKPAKETPATDSPLVSQADKPSQPSQPSTAAAAISSEQSKADADAAKPGLPAAAPDETKSESVGQENKDEDRKIAVAPLPATPPAPAAVADLPSDAGTMAKSPADMPKPSPAAGGSEQSAAAVPKPTETASIPAPPAMPKQSDARPAADSANADIARRRRDRE